MKRLVFYLILILFTHGQLNLFSKHALPLFPSKKSEDSYGSLSTNTGFLYGSIDEYVYNRDRKLSKLEWDLKPVIFIGNVLNTKIKGNVLISTGYWMGINENAGHMEDTDWDQFGEKTHHSRHHCHRVNARFFDINIGYSIIRGLLHRISLHIGFKSQVLRLEGRNGYVDNLTLGERIPVKGRFVQYEQKYRIPYLGSSWSIRFNRRFYFNLYSVYSPYVICKAKDIHISRNIIFYDTLHGGNYFFCNIALGGTIGSRYIITLSGTFCKINRFRGDTSMVDSGTGLRSETLKNAVAVGMKSWGCELSIGLLIIWKHSSSN